VGELQPEKVGVEWLILADSAQVLGNKVFLLGGGWDVLTVNQAFPVQQQLSIAVSFKVPWGEANKRHTVALEVATEDGQQLAQVAGQLEVGRPPGIRLGQAQRMQMGVNLVLNLPKEGVYEIKASVNGEEDSHRATFNVIPNPMLALPKPPEGKT
jgi:hypothetical protein